MPETLIFYPLDVTYKVKNNQAVISIYGKTSDNKRICITYPHLKPYFYVQPKNTSQLASGISQLIAELRILRPTQDNKTAEVTDVQHIERNFLGKPISILKVFTKLPRDVPMIKQETEKNLNVQTCYEYDIPFAKRYLMDTDVIPMLSTKAVGDFTHEHSRVPVFEASSIEPFGEEPIKDLRILSFDIETYNPPGKGIQADKHPILMVAFYGVENNKEFKKVITWKRFHTTKPHIEFVDGERELIERFKEVINQYQPDIITGYFTDGFDFPYIDERAKKHKILLDIGSDHSTIDVDTRNGVTQINGITHFDVFKFVRHVLARSLETDVFTLEAVATELLGEHKHDVDLDVLAHTWDNKPEQLEHYCEYNLQDAYITYKLCEKILPNALELSRLIGLPLFTVSRMSFSRLVESYIMKQAHSFNELIPNRPGYRDIQQRRTSTYQGAFVFQPTPGFYENVVVFDFRSLYPSIITSHNISPGSFQCSCCSELIPGEKYWFCKKRKAFLPSVLEHIITRRMRIKEILKSSPEKNTLLEARSESLKLLANSFYGYLGFAAARWYHLESAKSITALGRHYIQSVIAQAQATGFSVLYSDTDSIFMKLGNKTKEEALHFVENINTSLPGMMELDYEGFYPTAIFVSAKAGPQGAKKKYALLGENGKLKIRGFESVRRNWSIIAKEVQETIVNLILREKTHENALAYLQTVITELRAHTVPLEKVTICTQLQKPIASYDNVGPHVAVARRMQAKGQETSPGTIIKYIVTTGKGIIRDRAKLPEEVQNNDYDVDYYLNNQVIPAVDRIFEVLGVDINSILTPKTQSTLGKFF